MANLQAHMKKFHEEIKLKQYDENAELREKRERVLKRLRERLPKLFEEDEKAPSFEPFDQGSYAMDTGVQPVEGDYDLDEGLRFAIDKDSYPDPVTVKQWVLDAVEGHTMKVRMRGPCVTVYYQSEGEPIYHVDLAIYAAANADGKLYLGRGKPNSDAAHRIWEPADPLSLIKLIKGRFTGEDAAQFRRSIRYLKRWKDIKFDASGHAAPVGIALTVAAYYWFAQSKTLVDVFANRYEYDDLDALRRLVQRMLNQFVAAPGTISERLAVYLPVTPGNDLFAKMTDLQMASFREKLQVLHDALEAAAGEPDPVEACNLLKGQFGAAFPVPSKEESAQKKARAIVSSSASA